MPKRFIFRMMHVSNLETYYNDGCIRAKNFLPVQLGFQTSFGAIVHRRGTVFNTPCGNVVNDFVPFYFSPATSMAYTIHKRNVSLIGPDNTNHGTASMDDIAFVVCDVDNVANSVPDFWFTDIACNSGILPQYENDMTKLSTHIRWDLFDSVPRMGIINEIGCTGACRYCTDSELDPAWHNRTKQRMAEFLVKDSFPMSLADCIVIKQNGRKANVESWIANAGLTTPVIVNAGCYF